MLSSFVKCYLKLKCGFNGHILVLPVPVVVPMTVLKLQIKQEQIPNLNYLFKKMYL